MAKDNSRVVAGGIGLVGVAAMAYWYLTKGKDGGYVPPPLEPPPGDPEADLSCPPGYDCSVWATAISLCVGCPRSLVMVHYAELMSQDPHALTPEQIAELKALAEAIVAAQPGIERAYRQWIFDDRNATYHPDDPGLRNVATASYNAWQKLIEDEQKRQDDLMLMENKLLDEWTAYANEQTALLGTEVNPDPNTAWAAFYAARDVAEEAQTYMNHRLDPSGRQATVWSGGDFTGDSWGIPWGEWARCTELGIPNDAISSLKILKGVRLTFYNDINFKGAPHVFDTEDEAIEISGFSGGGGNDQMSSLKCEQRLGKIQAELNQKINNQNDCWAGVQNLQTRLGSVKRDCDNLLISITNFKLSLAYEEALRTRCQTLLDYVNSFNPIVS